MQITRQLDHHMQRDAFLPQPPSAEAMVRKGSQNMGAAKKMMKHDAGRHVNYCM